MFMLLTEIRDNRVQNQMDPGERCLLRCVLYSAICDLKRTTRRLSVIDDHISSSRLIQYSRMLMAVQLY